MSTEEEKPTIVEETELYSKLNKWSGTYREGPLTRNKNQVEVIVAKNDLISISKYLLEKRISQFVTNLSGVDYPENEGEQLEVVYHWASYENNKIIIVKTRTSYEDPVIPSLTKITQSVNFHEREAFDMFGIRFLDHPKADSTGALPRLLLPDEWPQYEDDPPYPFRKEYKQVARPFEKVTDTRGHQGKQWEMFNRPIDRSGWLDEYYKEKTPLDSTNTKKAFISESIADESEKEEQPKD